MHRKPENRLYLETALPRLNALLEEGRIELLLEEARQVLGVDQDDFDICRIAAGFLIDGGSVNLDLNAITQGMGLLEHALKEDTLVDEEELILLRYNLSNGHAALYTIYRKANNVGLAAASLQAQKAHLQGILLRRERIPAEILPAVLTNYANLLDHLHRTFEAVDQFLDCLEVEPSHGLAMGNCGEALRRVLHWSEQHQLENLQARWDLLSEAVGNPEGVLKWAGPPALSLLHKKLEALRSEVSKTLKGGQTTLEKFRSHRVEAHSHPQPAHWLQKILRDRLLLTFNVKPLISKHEAVDDAFFDRLSYGMSQEDEKESIDLINILNSIKEEFACARYLYYHSRDEQHRLTKSNSVTHYADPEGAAEFGLISGLLKTSLRLSVDLLDKIAVFLVLFLRLGDPRQGYNFTNFWFKDRDAKKGDLHPIVATKLQHNEPLMGLYDFRKDFFHQEFPGPAKDARNAAVHRWLILYWLPIQKEDDRRSSWNLNEFFKMTEFVLRQAKSAILTLIAVVNVEERRKPHRHPEIGALEHPLSVGPPRSSRV